MHAKPDFAKAHINLGNALAARQPERAIAHYRTAAEVEPDSVMVHSDLGNAFATLGKFDEAIGYCKRALEINPRSAEAHNNLGNALAHLGGTPRRWRSFGRPWP